MRKVILDLAVSLDGFIEGPNGEIDWLAGDGGGQGLLDFINSIDTIFYGRQSYDLWGNYETNESTSEFESKLWEAVHSKRKIVFSHGPAKDELAEWISTDLVERVKQFKEQPGKDIWLYGGASLITSFMNEGLIDVYRLSTFPVVLGAGKPLFTDIQKRINLKLTGVNTGESGVVQLIYEPA